ncbi:hypothetical protein [Ectothiorhodospira marina]|nr:hypothetical protein [Ectothiorhodospira marina]
MAKTACIRHAYALPPVTIGYTMSALDKTLILFLLGVLLFASPLVDWWSRPGMPWYLPYLLWGGLIGLGILIQLGRGRHDL